MEWIFEMEKNNEYIEKLVHINENVEFIGKDSLKKILKKNLTLY